ncbi:MAG: hypothetical protein ACM3S0_02085 [Acidobacteriota bacterium]
MNWKLVLLASAFALPVLLLAGCAGIPTPTAAPAPTKAPTATSPAASNPAASSASKSSTAAFEPQSNAGGSVTVDVKPTTLMVGEPVVFDVAMNTHSVDLADDLTKISILRDDAGREYKATAWDGPGGGGHHREGSLKFAALTTKPKYVELVIKGLAQVPERVFKWDLP